HHHLEEGTLLYRYPLIQFKSWSGSPAIVALEKGAEALMTWLEEKPKSLRVGRRTLPFTVRHLKLSQHILQVWNKDFNYTICNWLALNKDNLKAWEKTPSLTQRVQMLERILTAHILAFAEGVGWNVDKPVKVLVRNIRRQGLCQYKKVKWKSFDIAFITNVSLPDGVGLGKASSVGFGIVRRMRSIPVPEEGTP
ncbi:MAG: CRISPR-associated endonuclease Cas6, partial [Flavobacteriales bacterium]|nr:CRISPR-associated endonuclease Cas6 [Flavobacteriales bacterium]